MRDEDHEEQRIANDATRFAQANGWQHTEKMFTFKELAGLPKLPDGLSVWDDQNPILHRDLRIDHPFFFRQGDKPIAVVSMPYNDYLKVIRGIISRYGLEAVEPLIRQSGWWVPRRTFCFVIVRPDTTVQWLPEQTMYISLSWSRRLEVDGGQRPSGGLRPSLGSIAEPWQN
jgi:hypothetical protein